MAVKIRLKRMGAKKNLFIDWSLQILAHLEMEDLLKR